MRVKCMSPHAQARLSICRRSVPPMRHVAESHCTAVGDRLAAGICRISPGYLCRQWEEQHARTRGDGGIRRQAEWTKAARWVGGRPNGAVGVGDSTYAAGDGAVPLRQRVGDRQTLDGARSLQHVTRTALEADHSAHGKVVAHAPAVPRLRDGAALSGARLGYSFG